MNQDPELSIAGIWAPVPLTDTSSGYDGGLTQINAALVEGAGGQEDIVLDGWGAAPDPNGDPVEVDIAVLAPSTSGTYALDTSSLVSSAVTHGGGPIVVGDFNGDGRQDFMILPWNESPFESETGVSFSQNTSGGFDASPMPGLVDITEPQLVDLNGVQTVVTANYSTTDPVYQFVNGAWAEQTPPSLQTPGIGTSVALAQFGSAGAWEMARGTVGIDYLSPGHPAEWAIAIYGFDPTTDNLTPSDSNNISTPTQVITPYLSNLPQYKNYTSFLGVGLEEEAGLWTLDLNNDGHPDLLAEEDMWNPQRSDYPCTVQVLINNGDGTFTDETAALNSQMGVNNDILSFAPQFFSTDASGIDDIFFGSSSYEGSAQRQPNYLLLNDGTGHLYVALHQQFFDLSAEAGALVAQSGQVDYPLDPNYVAQFTAVPQADGSINFLAEYHNGRSVGQGSSVQFQSEYALVNVPLSYDPTTDFTQNVTISNRNGSDLMRTWAGDDMVDDVGGAAHATIDGGLGIDTSHYSGLRSAYTLTLGPAGQASVTGGGGGAPAVADVLKNFELVAFADQTVSLVADQNRLGDYDGVGPANLLIENTAGAVVVGAVSNGSVSYGLLTALGPEWRFRTQGDFLRHGDDQILIENASGAVVLAEDVGGAPVYTAVAALGPEWTFEGAGDFLGSGDDQMLIENTAGAVFVGDVSSGSAVYTQIASLGPEWSFVGTGDYLGDGRDDFLIESTTGAVVVGEYVGGTIQYTAVGALGPEWRFVGHGDFLGDGKTDFLIESTSGAVVAGEITAGHAVYTQLTALGPEWSFVGAGDYLGQGHDQFLIQSTSGAVVAGSWSAGATTYTALTALGQEWTFH